MVRNKRVKDSVCPEWHLVKGVFRGIFTPTKRGGRGEGTDTFFSLLRKNFEVTVDLRVQLGAVNDRVARGLKRHFLNRKGIA